MARDTHYDRFKKQKSEKLKNFRHLLEYGLLLSLRKFANRWSYRQNQRFGRWLGKLACLLARKDLGIARYQLAFCFPELSAEQRTELLQKTFENIGKTFFETLMIERIRQNPEQYIRLENEEVVHQALKAGKGAILMFGHVGNWELLPTIYEMLDIHGIAVESPIGDNRLDDLLLSVRKSEKIAMIPRGHKSSARAILSCFRQNGVFLFAMDQDTKVQSVFVNFFNRKASTAKGAATLGQKFNAPVISAFGARLDDDTHLYRFQLLSEPPYRQDEAEVLELTQRYTTALEIHIRRYPSQWVWFHRRWKTQPDQNSPDDPYKPSPHPNNNADRL